MCIQHFRLYLGAGIKGINDYIDTKNGLNHSYFPYNITDNCIPQIDIFLENGYTKEEMKMIEETKKILELPNLNLTATCVRIPILNCHSESINIEFENEINIEEIKEILDKENNIKVIDDIDNNIYPINEIANNTDIVYVGRIRRDYSIKNGLNLWVVADNVRVGAATNAVKILEKLIERRHEN